MSLSVFRRGRAPVGPREGKSGCDEPGESGGVKLDDASVRRWWGSRLAPLARGRCGSGPASHLILNTSSCNTTQINASY